MSRPPSGGRSALSWTRHRVQPMSPWLASSTFPPNEGILVPRELIFCRFLQGEERDRPKAAWCRIRASSDSWFPSGRDAGCDCFLEPCGPGLKLVLHVEATPGERAHYGMDSRSDFSPTCAGLSPTSGIPSNHLYSASHAHRGRLESSVCILKATMYLPERLWASPEHGRELSYKSGGAFCPPRTVAPPHVLLERVGRTSRPRERGPQTHRETALPDTSRGRGWTAEHVSNFP